MHIAQAPFAINVVAPIFVHFKFNAYYDSSIYMVTLINGNDFLRITKVFLEIFIYFYYNF